MNMACPVFDPQHYQGHCFGHLGDVETFRLRNFGWGQLRRVFESLYSTVDKRYGAFRGVSGFPINHSSPTNLCATGGNSSRGYPMKKTL
jgi:hypothetical protein